jgi:hypothetical protein
MLCARSITLVSLLYCPNVNPTKLIPAGQRCAVVAGQLSAPAKLNAPCAELDRKSVRTGIRNTPPDKETMRFARAVLNRPYKFTIAFLVINLFVFLLMWESSGLIRGPGPSFPEIVLIVYGAKLNYLINAPNNQWWRFITPMFVHIDVLHLLMNMFSLLILGPFVEKLYGSAKFVVLRGDRHCRLVASYLTLRPGLRWAHWDVSFSKARTCLQRVHLERCLD